MQGVPQGAPFMFMRSENGRKIIEERFNAFSEAESTLVVLTVCLVLGHERRLAWGAFHVLWARSAEDAGGGPLRVHRPPAGWGRLFDKNLVHNPAELVEGFLGHFALGLDDQDIQVLGA